MRRGAALEPEQNLRHGVGVHATQRAVAGGALSRVRNEACARAREWPGRKSAATAGEEAVHFCWGVCAVRHEMEIKGEKKEEGIAFIPAGGGSPLRVPRGCRHR